MTEHRTHRARPTAIAAFAAAAILLAHPGAAAGQDAPALPDLTGNDSTMVERVAAVVGDSVITMTEVLEEYQVAQARGQEVTAEQVLEQLVEIQLVLQAAARDTTIQISDEEIEGRVEEAVAQVRQRFPTDQAYQRALGEQGLTPQEYRDQLRARIRTEQIQQSFMRKHLASTGSVPVTEEEMRAFFEERRGTLQRRPELLTLEQVLVEPTASDSAWTAAREEADSLRALVLASPDSAFAEVAEASSDDPGSAANGGDLGWFRRGVMVREFEDVAFQLRDGQVSQPVRSKFGYHVIKVEKTRPGEVKARHILVRPEVADGDAARALERAEEAVRLSREGVGVDSLRTRFGDEDLPGEIEVARDQLSELPYDAVEALADASEGDVVGPLPASIGGQTYQAVIRVVEVREAGDFTFEELRDQIRQQLSRSKRVDRIFERLRRSTYVDIRM